MSADRISRREFFPRVAALTVGGILAAKAVLETSCSPKEAILVQEYNIPVNGQVIEIPDVKRKVNSDVGVDRMLLFGVDEPPLIFVFFELSENEEPLPLGIRRTNPNLQNESAFIPYDKSFDLKKAKAYISEHLKDNRVAIPGGFDTAAQASKVFDRYRLKAGYMVMSPIPAVNTDLMYFFSRGFNLIRQNNSEVNPSPAAILRARIKFLGYNPDQPSSI